MPCEQAIDHGMAVDNGIADQDYLNRLRKQLQASLDKFKPVRVDDVVCFVVRS